jgi:Ser/Thr protein kinase RdoA (MazF antagonist)
VSDLTGPAQPFARLSPDVVLDAAAALGLDCDGRLFALNSYENRVYRVGAHEGAPWILKFYRPERWSDAQILEEHAFARELGARDVRAAQPLLIKASTLHRHEGFRLTAFEFAPGRAPELDAPLALQMLGRALARLHSAGATGRFRTRPALTVARLGGESRATILASDFLPSALVPSYEAASGRLLEAIAREFEELADVGAIRIHGDCHVGNILWDEHGPLFVDLDDCMSGPRVQDLWMFLSGEAAEQRSQWEALAAGYQEFSDFDYRELRLIEPLRGLRIMHHAAWIARRWDDPAFPRAFPWFAEPRYWERHIADLLEQHSAVLDPPLLRG